MRESKYFLGPFINHLILLVILLIINKRNLRLPSLSNSGIRGKSLVMSIYMYIASLAYFFMLVGVLERRHRSLHVPLMLSALSLDFALVLYLEVTRAAVEKALEFSMRVPAQIHIAFSSTALLLYFPVLYFAFRILRGSRLASDRSRHIGFALAALTFRSLGFIFMFSMYKAN